MMLSVRVATVAAIVLQRLLLLLVCSSALHRGRLLCLTKGRAGVAPTALTIRVCDTRTILSGWGLWGGKCVLCLQLAVCAHQHMQHGLWAVLCVCVLSATSGWFQDMSGCAVYPAATCCSKTHAGVGRRVAEKTCVGGCMQSLCAIFLWHSAHCLVVYCQMAAQTVLSPADCLPQERVTLSLGGPSLWVGPDYHSCCVGVLCHQHVCSGWQHHHPWSSPCCTP